MTQFHYRQEDQFREEGNKRRLKELLEAGDINGLYEMAILLNHELCFNNSKLNWVVRDSLAYTQPVSDRHVQMATETIQEITERMMRRQQS